MPIFCTGRATMSPLAGEVIIRVGGYNPLDMTERCIVEQQQWYYMLNSERFGPIDQPHIEQLFASGQLSFETMVWSQQFTNWTAAANVPTFARLQPVHAGAAVSRAETPRSNPETPAVHAFSEPQPARMPAHQPGSGAAETDKLANLIRHQTAAAPTTNQVLIRNEHFFASFLKNAYRVVGITGATPQQELKKTVSNIRRQIKVGKAYTSPVDLAWIGAPVSRQEKDLLDAETRLLNPDTRVKERLLWFHSVPEGFPTQMTVQEAVSTAQTVFQSGDPLARHDAAVLMQFAAIADSPEFERAELWNHALSLWRTMQQDEAYWMALCEIDDQLGYEPVCLASDVLSHREKFMELITEPIVLLSKEALNHGNQQLFARAAALINPASSSASQQENGPADNAGSSEIADEFHRMMNSYCDEIAKMLDGIDRSEKTYKASKQKNLDICGHCETIFDYEVQKLLDNAKAALPESSTDMAHLKESAATILEMIGGAYTWADDYVNAVRMLERAEDLARNTALEPKIAETLDNYRKSLEMQKTFGEQKRVNSAPLLFTMNTCGFNFYPALGEQAEPYLGSKRGIYYLVIAFFPVFPLASYRAIFHPNGSFSFISRIPLDKYARIHQAVVLGPIIAMFLFAMFYKPSPAELARREAERIQQIETNTSAAIARVRAHEPVPTGKYDLKDRVKSDDEALEDLKGRLERTQAILEKQETDLKAEAAAIKVLHDNKKTDKKEFEERVQVMRDHVADLNKLGATYDSTLALAKQILADRNKAADSFNDTYASH
jgi:hypothetical protein